MAPHHLSPRPAPSATLPLHAHESQAPSAPRLTSCSRVTRQTLCHSAARPGLLSTEPDLWHRETTHVGSGNLPPQNAVGGGGLTCRFSSFSSPTVMPLILSCVPNESVFSIFVQSGLYYKTIAGHSSYCT